MSDFIYLLTVVLFAGVFALFFFFNYRKSRVDETQTTQIRDLERGLTDFMFGQLKEIRRSVDGSSKAMYEQIHSFTKEATQIQERLKQIHGALDDVSSFQELFKSPKLRGEWGEASLNHILSQHFPKELYQTQYLFSSGEQVDAVLKLPDGKLLPIDAKFSSVNFERMKEAASETEREPFRRKFLADVKFNIDKIASKYILPSESTLDYALMYIPAEAIYYEIMAKEMDLTNYARSRKVALASPNTFYSTLRIIEHWFQNIQISRRTQELLKRLNRVYQDADKLMDDFRKLGSHLRDATSAYNSSEKRLSLFSEKVERLMETAEDKSTEQTKPSEQPSV